MKKIIISIIGLALILSIYSCKKDKDTPDGLIMQESEMIKRSRKVISLIENFKDKMEYDLKSGESISLDSAVWNMEATLNYDYADPDSASALFVTRKSVYTLDIDANEFATLSDVQTVYDLMEDTLEMQFLDLINTVKIIVMCDVSIDSTDANNAYLTLTNGFGLDLATQYDPFDEDDDWIWGTISGPLVGKCDGSDSTSDGSNELQKRLNNPLLVPGEQIFYTDIIALEATGEDFLDENGAPRLYMGWNYPQHNCLNNDTLTYYLWQSDEIIHTYSSEGGLRPANKSFVSLEIIDSFNYKSGSNNQYLHYYDVIYGKPTTVPPGN